MLILGLDPGGKGSFGWCLAEPSPRRLKLVRCGVANNAREAIDSAIQPGITPDAAGVDSPMFWTARGDRACDQELRKRIPGDASGGTVQNINSLRGACLAQGLLASWLLRRKFPLIRLTESHPKALLWCLNIPTAERRIGTIELNDLSEYFELTSLVESEHIRDAALAALSGWAMLTHQPGWRNLAEAGEDVFTPVPRVEYWMPVAKASVLTSSYREMALDRDREAQALEWCEALAPDAIPES